MARSLALPLFEAASVIGEVGFVPPLPPGSPELGKAVGLAAASGKKLIWMERHGLTAWGHSPEEALALSETAEHLARIALKSL
jgi:ribulose-5-phosphate 4-epimerase/fuculose-1-phosphate aldolase